MAGNQPVKKKGIAEVALRRVPLRGCWLTQYTFIFAENLSRIEFLSKTYLPITYIYIRQKPICILTETIIAENLLPSYRHDAESSRIILGGAASLLSTLKARLLYLLRRQQFRQKKTTGNKNHPNGFPRLLLLFFLAPANSLGRKSAR